MKKALFFLIAFSPLPFASARPIWQWFWIVYLAALTFLFIKSQSRRWLNLSMTPEIGIALLLFTIFCLWGFAQAIIPTGAATGDLLVFLSGDPAATLKVSSLTTAHALFFVFLWAVMRRLEDVIGLIDFLSVVVFCYAAYGFVEYVTGNGHVLWYQKIAYADSLTSTFINRNSFAAYVGLGANCVIASLGYRIELLRSRADRDYHSTLYKTSFIPAIFCFLMLAVFLITMVLFLTGSRAGLLTTTVAMFISIIGFLWKAKVRKIHLLVSSLSVVAAFISISMLSGGLLQSRLESPSPIEDDPRFVAMPLMTGAISDKPLTGHGLGTFESAFRQYRTNALQGYFDRGHSDVLELTMTAGIPATAIFLSVFLLVVAALLSALKSSREHGSLIIVGLACTVQLGAHSLVDFSMQMPAVSFLYTAIIAASLRAANMLKRH